MLITKSVTLTSCVIVFLMLQTKKSDQLHDPYYYLSICLIRLLISTAEWKNSMSVGIRLLTGAWRNHPSVGKKCSTIARELGRWRTCWLPIIHYWDFKPLLRLVTARDPRRRPIWWAPPIQSFSSSIHHSPNRENEILDELFRSTPNSQISVSRVMRSTTLFQITI